MKLWGEDRMGIGGQWQWLSSICAGLCWDAQALTWHKPHSHGSLCGLSIF